MKANELIQRKVTQAEEQEQPFGRDAFQCVPEIWDDFQNRGKNGLDGNSSPKYSGSMKSERSDFDTKAMLLMILCCASVLLSGCAAGISRTGYQLPKGQKSKELELCPIAIQNNAKYDTNDVVVLGSIHAYDTSLSTDCDEAYVLDIFCREACMLGADLISITEEKQPSIWTSTCYRARAQFLRFNDRKKAKALVSDAKYAPDLIIDRSAKSNKRNKDAIIGTVLGGPLVGLVVWSATDPHKPTKYTNSIPLKGGEFMQSR